jgi:two-component system, LuxR family, response regulator FixJ
MSIDNDNTIFVVDDDGATRDAVVAMVGSKGLRAEGFASTEDFLRRYDPADRGCVIVDVRMADMAGLALIRTLNERKLDLPVIVITSNADVPLAVQSMQEGAFRFLQKPAKDDELWKAIEEALQVDSSRQAHRKERSETKDRLATLTADELEVFRRLLAGHANKRIASDLDIGLRTVELRRSNIMKKMQATSLPDLVRMAILIDFLKPVGPIEA